MYPLHGFNNDQWLANLVSCVPHPLSPMFSDYLKQIPEVIAFQGIFSCIRSKILTASHGLPWSNPCWLLQLQIKVGFPQPSRTPVQTQSKQPSLRSSIILCCLLMVRRPSGWIMSSALKAWPLTSFTLFAQLQRLLLLLSPCTPLLQRPLTQVSLYPALFLQLHTHDFVSSHASSLPC